MITSALLYLSTLVTASIAADDSKSQLPSTGEVVARMIQSDRERQSALAGYTAARRYILENRNHNKRAEMLVRVTCLKNGSKQFETVSSSGWGAARKHVFPRLLEAEAEASTEGLRERSRIIPENYSFELAGTDNVGGRPAYVLEIAPKTSNKYLMRGKIWVDAEEYAIVRTEGTPAKNPSFWIKNVHFVHTYEKQGQFWFPVFDRSVTDARIFGATEVSIDYFDYAPNLFRETSQGRMP